MKFLDDVGLIGAERRGGHGCTRRDARMLQAGTRAAADRRPDGVPAIISGETIELRGAA